MSATDWYALQVRPRYESIVPMLLASKGYETFAPVYRSRRKWSDRTKEVEAPLFPGYVFCRFNPGMRSANPVVTTPGVLKILGFANKPAPLDAREMESVRLAAKPEAFPEPYPYLSEGSKIKITHGPFTGIEGILANVKNRDLLVISISMLQRSISVEIEKDAIAYSDLTVFCEWPPSGEEVSLR